MLAELDMQDSVEKLINIWMTRRHEWCEHEGHRGMTMLEFGLLLTKMLATVGWEKGTVATSVTLYESLVVDH